MLHLSRKIIFPKLKIGCSKMKLLSGNQRPDLLRFVMNMSLVLRLPREMHLCRSSANAPCLPFFWKYYKTITCCSLLVRCKILCACHAKTYLNLQEWSEHVVLFNILTWTCASRHNGVHFCDITTFEGDPTLVCFAHFDLEMCFAPQRRAPL